ncbi:cysteine-rich receptor-like protein kinase 25 isoform X2 [Ipomoea triloba]|uniref:cysteine-rich receptor-like protein kinase 25 isoform X2 n=1 Tax=Ipomoea triloba TaxID=35885 RepID=UPI00125DF1A2|nr:cysteine-rich receptor-like protein kinase 25 isoform X2 [Ipomoea triloba]
MMTMMMIWFCLLMRLITKTSSDLALLLHCRNTTTYTPNSTYKANLDSLLSILSSNDTRENGFYHARVGGEGSNDTVYGLFLCRGDVPPEVCKSCVVEAGVTLPDLCNNGKTAIIWYDNCMVRYSEKSMLGIIDLSTGVEWTNKENGTEPNRYMQFVGKVFDQIITRASSGSDKKFAVLEANFSVFEMVYALGQCTPDLSNVECQICLRNVTAKLPSFDFGSRGARVVYPSCNIRYEQYPFYYLSALAAPPPPPLVHPYLPRTTLPKSVRSKGSKGKSSVEVIIAASVVSITGISLLAVSFCFLKMKRAKKSHFDVKETTTGMTEIPTGESTQYEFGTIEAITNWFSHDNEIGEGGYGAVYKGRLPNGQDVAVKRLSRGSTQGAQEFMNEVEIVAKLQHRNLVRLLGFCYEGEEKILIYEFVLNKSLNYFLFDQEKQNILDWLMRYKIIRGIARGLLYLHEDSRLRIIHRDLKISNILLDANMNPKIADFGMAKIFGVNQTEGNTNRIVGTYGYMSPEYAMHGEFSVKSDVFSFGVVLLEIITGAKNRNFCQSNKAQDLLSYAWEQWRDGTPLNILDPILAESYIINEVIQCIYISLLCVQEDVDERPTMPEWK